MTVIGKNIRTLRQRQSWSQGEVARQLEISIPAFSKIETGITDVNMSRLEQIATLFQVTVIDLISKEGEQHHSENAAEISMLKEKLALKEDEIINLQKKVIDLYEEIRNMLKKD